MSTNESLGSKPNKLERLKTGLRAGAVAVGLVLPASASAETHKHATKKAPESLGALITAKEKQTSHDIARKTPITFKNSLAYYHGPGEDFFIDNPLTAIVKEGDKKVKLLGYIERKGGPTGPDVVLFPYDKRTTSLSPNNDDPVNGQPESQVIFPSPNGSSFDPNNPVDPLTGDPLHDRFGPDERILVGDMYTSTTK